MRGAAETFEKQGYVGASVGTIIENAGLTKGALYFHFRSKDELARCIVAEQHAISIASVEAIGREQAPAIEQIVMLCHEMARQIVHDPIVRAGIRITLELSADEHELSADEQGPTDPYLDWINTCEQLARRAIEQGDLKSDIDPPRLARFVIGAFTGVQTVSQVLAHRTDLEQRVDDMWMFLLPGIMPTGRHPDIERIRQARSVGAPAVDSGQVAARR